MCVLLELHLTVSDCLLQNEQNFKIWKDWQASGFPVLTYTISPSQPNTEILARYKMRNSSGGDNLQSTAGIFKVAVDGGGSCISFGIDFGWLSSKSQKNLMVMSMLLRSNQSNIFVSVSVCAGRYGPLFLGRI